MKRKLFVCVILAIVSVALRAAAPKYIFIIFGDGMGMNTICMAENHASYVAGKPLGFRHMNFREFPYMGMCDTYASDRLATGSSEAATALFCGQKGYWGQVGMNPAHEPLESIFTKLHGMGYKVGLMSTDPINHATPAAAYAHVDDRGDFRSITRQLPASGFEFLAGNSFIDHDHVDGAKNTDEFLLRYGYPTYYGLSEFGARDKSLDKVILANYRNKTNKSKITAQTDKDKNYILEERTEDLTLAQMLSCCLEHLGDAKPFILLCEQGEIDHACHSNLPMSAVESMYDLENTVALALEFYASHPDETLIVVLSDHETGGVALRGTDKGIDWQPMIDQWNSDKPKDSYDRKSNRELSTKCGIRWASSGHTGAPTPIFSKGCCAEFFSGAMDNTEFAGKILRAVGAE